MSRLIVFDLANRATGELSGMLNRGWMMAGNPAVAGGGSTTMELTDEQATKSFLQFGGVVLVQHPRLPAWAGVIDPPWSAAPPLGMTIYNCEYLLSIRAPELIVKLSGGVGRIADQIINLCNSNSDLGVRLGDVSQADTTSREETLDGRSYWAQLVSLAQRSGCEIQTRPERDADGRLVVYIDIAQRLGVNTGYEYSDGAGGSAVFSDVVMDGPIVNRLVGIGDESGEISRLRTAPFENTESIAAYRMRSEAIQFRDVREQSTLDNYTLTYLSYRVKPRLSFTMHIHDEGDNFINARLGNIVRAHISQARLPGGVRGWRGQARILAMAYTETDGILSAMMETI